MRSLTYFIVRSLFISIFIIHFIFCIFRRNSMIREFYVVKSERRGWNTKCRSWCEKEGIMQTFVQGEADLCDFSRWGIWKLNELTLAGCVSFLYHCTVNSLALAKSIITWVTSLPVGESGRRQRQQAERQQHRDSDRRQGNLGFAGSLYSYRYSYKAIYLYVAILCERLIAMLGPWLREVKAALAELPVGSLWTGSEAPETIKVGILTMVDNFVFQVWPWHTESEYMRLRKVAAQRLEVVK